MLVSLHVKNLALIDEAEVSFGEGLNILTGETGAGKSVLLGSINMALGDKAAKDSIRTGEDSALAELTFRLDNKRQREALSMLGIEPEEDAYVILKRKIFQGRSVCSVNGETVTAAQVRELSQQLLHVHGQRDNQILLKPEQQRNFLDHYAGEKAESVLEQLSGAYAEYQALEKEYLQLTEENGAGKRELELAQYEIAQIESVKLREGEAELLEKAYKKMQAARGLMEAAAKVAAITGFENEMSAGSLVGAALREMRSVASQDEDAAPLLEELESVDAVLSDFSREIAGYMDSLSFDEAEYREVTMRYDEVRRILDKFGPTQEDVERYYETQLALVQKYGDIAGYKERLSEKVQTAKAQVLGLCQELTLLREEAAAMLGEALKKAMQELNFLETQVEIRLVPEKEPGRYGAESVAFYISLNPGEALKPLSDVASGGELSRIMLALRTIQASEIGVGTMIFDEIDQGISGKTAWKVSERLKRLSADTQVICITHLSQIAAGAAVHFIIEKDVQDGRTTTRVRQASEEETVRELARMNGGEELTQAALDAAREMRRNALHVD